MLSTAELERALAAAGLHAPVRFEEVTGSTNATAEALARDGSPEWTLVAAGHQTAGRGRLGRPWVDRPGEALMCSIVLRPAALPPSSAGLISLLAGASMAAAAAQLSGLDVRCKWPNDLLVDEGKVGGILAESSVEDGRIRYVVVGVGVNLAPPPDVPDAVGLGRDVDPADLLAAFLGRLREGYLPDDPRFGALVLERWRARNATLGLDVEAIAVDGSAIRGRALDVDGGGALVVETAEGPIAISSGEVRHLRRA